MKQIIVSILLLIPLLGFGQVDSLDFPMYKGSLICINQTDTSIIQYNKDWFISSDPNRIYLIDTLRFERIYTFDFYEQLPCTVYTAQEELFCYALMKTTYYRYGESGEWASEGRWFVNFVDANDDVMFFEPGEVLFVHLQTRRP